MRHLAAPLSYCPAPDLVTQLRDPSAGVLTLPCVQKSPGDLITMQTDSGGQGLRVCMSDKLPSEANADLGTAVQETRLQGGTGLWAQVRASPCFCPPVPSPGFQEPSQPAYCDVGPWEAWGRGCLAQPVLVLLAALDPASPHLPPPSFLKLFCLAPWIHPLQVLLLLSGHFILLCPLGSVRGPHTKTHFCFHSGSTSTITSLGDTHFQLTHNFCLQTQPSS